MKTFTFEIDESDSHYTRHKTYVLSEKNYERALKRLKDEGINIAKIMNKTTMSVGVIRCVRTYERAQF